MPRLPHGATITLAALRNARAAIAERSGDLPLAFVAAPPVDVQDFDFLFPELQNNAGNLLPEAAATPARLVQLGKSMLDDGNDARGDSDVPAAYTYFGQFVDHDITLETASATLEQLIDPGLTPLPVERIRGEIRNLRTASLDLDSVYGIPAPRNGDRMVVGKVTNLNGTALPRLRPNGKEDENDLPREPRNAEPARDRAALIGDPRNDENTIIAQMHVAFLKAHNKLVDQGKTFLEARRTLRQHYQHIVLFDFLREQIADRGVMDAVLKKERPAYDVLNKPFFMPLEYAVAAYRFGHSMVREAYDFNLNFNLSGKPGTVRGTLGLLFTFTALQGDFNPGGAPDPGTDTLPENWIIEWDTFVDVGKPFNKARRFDTKLVEPLFHLRKFTGEEEMGMGAHLAVRNLLRGYLLRIPTGQAVARAYGLTPLAGEEIEAAAASDEQRRALRDGEFLNRTPLWYYLLAEAAAPRKSAGGSGGDGRRLGRLGSTIVAEVLVGLVRRSEDSILRDPKWRPSLPGARGDTFTLANLLQFAGVL